MTGQQIETRRIAPPATSLMLDGVDGRTMAKAIAASGMFPSVKTEAQALVKIQMGLELGISPMASVQGIHWIQTDKGSRLMLGGDLCAQLIKRERPRHDYRIREHDEKHCVVDYIEDGEVLGFVEYSIEDAKKAGLVRDRSNWVTYPRDMLFNRCITRIIKRFCPQLAGALVPEREEWADKVAVSSQIVDEIDGDGEPVRHVPTPEAGPSPDKLRKKIFAIAHEIGLDDDRRHALLRDLFGKESLSALTYAELVEFADELDQRKKSGSHRPLSEGPVDEPGDAPAPTSGQSLANETATEKGDGGTEPSPAPGDPLDLDAQPPGGEPVSSASPAWLEQRAELDRLIASKNLDVQNVLGRVRMTFKKTSFDDLDLDELQRMVKFVGTIKNSSSGDQGRLA